MLILVLIAVVFIFFLLSFVILLYLLFGHPKNPPLKRGLVNVGATQFQVEVADTLLTRTRGLSGREPMPDTRGMAFIFSRRGRYAFWMKDVILPLDMVWIAGDVIVGFSQDIQPQPGASLLSLKMYHPPVPVSMVLELFAGDVQKFGLKLGDSVAIIAL